MRAPRIVLVVCMLLAGLSTAMAESITLYQNGYSYIDGGEFTAHTGPNNYLSNYSPKATLNGGFETFCVQSEVEFYPGTTYSYVLTDTESTGQKLTLGAAFLYSQFATGKLPLYDYLNTTGDRLFDNGELQVALWTFQGQTIPNYGFPSVSGDPFYNLAISDLGGRSAAFAPNKGAYDVDIIQLYNADGSPAQAQLLYGSPEPPTILLLVFAGTLMFLLNRRKILRVS